MKNYQFLLKPAFFIFNLLFSTWLVFQIEKISPSDFGKYKSLFEASTSGIKHTTVSLSHIRQLSYDFKAGLLDSTEFNQKLNLFLLNTNALSEK